MFDSRYEAVLADRDVARRVHYQIRYQVYCLEAGFEDAAAFPDGEEKDEYDQHSAHFMVRRRHTDDWVGAMRLVLPQDRPLPIERLTAIDSKAIAGIDLENIAEVSRLSLVGCVRRARSLTLPDRVRKNDSRVAGGDVRQRRRSQEVTLGLLRAAIRYCQRQAIRFLFLLITPAFARMLRRMRIELHPIGPSCEYRGFRYPYMVDLSVSAERLAKSSAAVEAMFQRPAAYVPFSLLAREGVQPGSQSPLKPLGELEQWEAAQAGADMPLVPAMP